MHELAANTGSIQSSSLLFASVRPQLPVGHYLHYVTDFANCWSETTSLHLALSFLLMSDNQGIKMLEMCERNVQIRERWLTLDPVHLFGRRTQGIRIEMLQG